TKKKKKSKQTETKINNQICRSFFYPKKEGKAKKPEKETSNSIRETEPPPKVALKERNGEVPESDSPVKRPGRKVARVLGSEGEEEDEALTPSKGQVGPHQPIYSLFLEEAIIPIISHTEPFASSARKQLPKRTIQDVLEEQSKDEDREAKKKKEEEGEAPGGRREGVHSARGRESGRVGPLPEARLLGSPISMSLNLGVAIQNPVHQQPLDPPSYNPAKNNYHPIDDACWKPGQKVPYLAVARTFEKIEEVSARLRMVETLSNLLRSVVALSPPDLLPILYLSLNRLGPPQQGLELGVGDGVLLKAVAQATGRQLDSVKAEAAEKGDVGLVAENSRSTQRLMLPPPALTAAGVFAKFRDIARLAGSASTAKKIDVIKGLFVACRHSEARFIARALSGRLRLGLAEQSVLAALAQAVSLTPPGQEFPPADVDAGKGRTAEARKTWLEEQSMILKQTFCEVPDLDRIIPVLLEHGLEHLPEHCRLSPGVPLKPMLAHPTRGVSEVLKRFEEAAFTCEYKYDGQRAQIHVLEGGEVKIFSRNQEDNTGKYPDIISRIPKIKLPSVTSFILDTEAVAWDREKKQIQPFQVLTTRKRKEVDAAEIQVQVCLYAFDLIYLNGESLVREPLSRRRQLLRENFVETEGEFVFATSLDTKDTDQIAEFLEQSVKDSCEGLMVKTLDVDATYEIAKRSHNWLKLKKDYLDGVGDTLDLVVIGAYLGRGKRAGRYGGFLLAAYDEESEELQAICKLGTGFSDEELEEHYQRLQALVLPTPRSYVRVDGAVAPDHWLDPSAVWEVKCADLSLSPIYPAARGLVDGEKGISLRFPRFIRVREDKKPEEATTSGQVACLYMKQSQIQNQQGADLDSDSDFY
uniref:DNA ligase n=1 Tax=Canis lupus dingo TaxID=286419 RepID=A0A8C0LRL4_CANLU